MDASVIGDNQPAIPVTLALACALDVRGDLFSAAQAVIDQPTVAQAAMPVVALLHAVLAPLLAMGAVYKDTDGRKRVDRQAVLDFAVVCCGLSEHAALHDIDLRYLALHHRKMSGQQVLSAELAAELSQLFPDTQGDQHDK